MCKVSIYFAAITPTPIYTPFRQSGRLPDVPSESVLKPEPPVCRYLLPDCIKSKDKLQITLFLTDACSQPIANIGQTKQHNNQKQSWNHNNPPRFRHQCFIRQ